MSEAAGPPPQIGRMTYCPPFTEDLVLGGAQKQLELLRHAFAQRELRDPSIVARTREFVAARVEELRQGAVLAGAADLPQLPETVARAIEELRLDGASQATLIGYCRENLAAYEAMLGKDRGVQAFRQTERITFETLRQRLNEALAIAKGTRARFAAPDPVQRFAALPTGGQSTHGDWPRVFRVLVWNLENFTRDQRPNHTSPLDSLRNQTRIAAVAETMHHFDVHLLLAMETGSDVGTAMTKVAERVAARRATVEDRGPVHPLVSPTTHARPHVEVTYDSVGLGPAYPHRALALRTLSEVYRIVPDYPNVPAEVTLVQVNDALALLNRISNDVQAAGFAGAPLEVGEGQLLRHVLLEGWVEAIKRAISVVDKSFRAHAGPDASLVIDWMEKVLDAESALDDSVTAPGYYLRYLVETIELIRGTVEDFQDLAGLDTAPVIGPLLVADLLGLFLLKLARPGVEDVAALYESESAGGGLLPLVAFYYTGIQKVSLRCVDPRGPLAMGLDHDVLFESLLKVGILKFRFETYGMVFRPTFPDAVASMFAQGIAPEDSDDVAIPAYESYEALARRDGIVVQALSEHDYAVQQADHILTQRSPFLVHIPASPIHMLPMAVYHVRYGGSQAISERYKADFAYGKAVAEVVARLDSLAASAEAMLPGVPFWGPPLIVGDFNTPAEYIEGLGADTQQAAAGRAFVAKMQSLGYLRHDLRTPDQAAAPPAYPRTTLKIPANIAIAPQECLSQPYDGVYEPFHYASSTVATRSAVLDVQGVMTADLLDLHVAAPIAKWEELIADETQEEQPPHDDEDDDGTMLVEDSPAQATDSPLMTVRQAIAGALGTEYLRLFGRMEHEIAGKKNRKRMPQHVASYVGWLGQRIPEAARGRRPSPLFGSADAVTLIGLSPEFIAHRNARVDWFIRCCETGKLKSWAEFHQVADPVDAWLVLANRLKDAAGGSAELKPEFTELANLLTRLRTLLAAYETNQAVRDAVAYRVLVSDHLPVLLEFDLRPE